MRAKDDGVNTPDELTEDGDGHSNVYNPDGNNPNVYAQARADVYSPRYDYRYSDVYSAAVLDNDLDDDDAPTVEESLEDDAETDEDEDDAEPSDEGGL